MSTRGTRRTTPTHLTPSTGRMSRESNFYGIPIFVGETSRNEISFGFENEGY